MDVMELFGANTFMWERDSSGYRLEDGRVLKIGGKPVALTTDEKINVTHRFANIKTAPDVLEFVHSFGFLGVESQRKVLGNRTEDLISLVRSRSKNRRAVDLLETLMTPEAMDRDIHSEDVSTIISRAELVRRTIGRLDQHRKSYAELNRTLRKNTGSETHDQRLLFDPFNKLLQPELTLKISGLPNDKSAAVPVVMPRRLIDFIELQVGLQLTGTLLTRACEACGRLFTINPKDGNQRRRKWCSDACRGKAFAAGNKASAKSRRKGRRK